MAKVLRRNMTENFNRLSRAHERYRQTTDRRTTDGRAIAYSERELTFTFAKNCSLYTLAADQKNAKIIKGTINHTNIDIQAMLVWLYL